MYIWTGEMKGKEEEVFVFEKNRAILFTLLELVCISSAVYCELPSIFAHIDLYPLFDVCLILHHMASPDMFIHPPSNGHLDCLSIFTAINHAARNRFVHISLHLIIIISLEEISKSIIVYQGMHTFLF